MRLSEDKILLSGLCGGLKHCSGIDAPQMLHAGCRSLLGSTASWCLAEETFWTE